VFDVSAYRKSGNIWSFAFTSFVLCLIIFSYYPDWLNYSTKEDGLVENASVIFCFLGAYACIQNFFLRRKLFLGSSVILLLGGMALLFVGGEEISWGQRIIAMKPILAIDKANYQREFTLHNIHGLDTLIYYGGFWGFVMFMGILPILTYFFEDVKKFLIKVGVPLMPRCVNFGVWLGILWLVAFGHIIYEKGRGLIFIPDVESRLQEFREFYFYFLACMYVAVEYFYLLKYKRIYNFGFGEISSPEKKGAIKNFLKDALLFITQNKPLILFSLVVFYILSPLSAEFRQYRIYQDRQSLEADGSIKITQGERPKASNASGYFILIDKKAFNKKFLSFSADNLLGNEPFFFRYLFSISKRGYYKIFIAGSPPGPLGAAQGIDFSPYDVVIDGGEPISVNQEKKNAELKKIFGHNFYTYYVYTRGMTFTKLGEFEFEEGDHVIDFKISKRDPYGNRYSFLLDALFIAPVSWKPAKEFLTLPDDVFSY